MDVNAIVKAPLAEILKEVYGSAVHMVPLDGYDLKLLLQNTFHSYIFRDYYFFVLYFCQETLDFSINCLLYKMPTPLLFLPPLTCRPPPPPTGPRTRTLHLFEMPLLLANGLAPAAAGVTGSLPAGRLPATAAVFAPDYTDFAHLPLFCQDNL